jgi:hypothetical protein
MVYETQINGCKIALLEDGNYYLCDSQFDKIYPVSFQDLKHKFSNYFIGKRNDKWALLDCLGNMYSDFLYEKIIWFEGDLFFPAGGVIRSVCTAIRLALARFALARH